MTERLLRLVALRCSAYFAMKPIVEGRTVDSLFSSFFRYNSRSRRSQKRDHPFDISHSYEDIVCENALFLDCESVHESGMCTSQGRRF
jgi:hypothetical protein